MLPSGTGGSVHRAVPRLVCRGQEGQGRRGNTGSRHWGAWKQPCFCGSLRSQAVQCTVQASPPVYAGRPQTAPRSQELSWPRVLDRFMPGAFFSCSLVISCGGQSRGELCAAAAQARHHRLGVGGRNLWPPAQLGSGLCYPGTQAPSTSTNSL